MANYFSKQDEAIRNDANAQYGNLSQEQLDYLQMLQSMNYGSGGIFNNMTDAWGMSRGGPGGYSQQQMADILGLNEDGGLNGVNPMSQEYADYLQLTPDERAAMIGNPNAVRDIAGANVAQLGMNVARGNQGVQDAAAKGGQDIMGAIGDRSKLGLSDSYTGAVGGALGDETSRLDTATGNPDLALSDEFKQNYQFGPKDVQDIQTAAGTTVGNRYRSAIDDMYRNAAASGTTSPLALAAARDRLERDSASSAGEAMTDARIKARNEQLGVEQTREQLRLGTTQDISSREMQAAEALAGSRLGAATSGEQMRMAGATTGLGLGLTAAEQAAALRQNAAQFGANQLTSSTEFGTNANMQAGEYADQAGATRAGQVATNRQNTGFNTQGTQYQQGMGVNQAKSNRYQSVYGQQQQNQQAYRQWLASLYGQTQSGIQSTMGQQSNTLGQKFGVMQKSNSDAYTQRDPSIWSKILGAGAAFAGGFAGGI